MTSDPRKNALRLRKSHEPDPEPPPDREIGQRLWDAQSIHRAIVASLVAILVFAVLWVMVSNLLNRYFPWATLLLGCLIGFAVRRAGLGLSWPFPVIAAVATVIGAVMSSVGVAAVLIAQQMDSSLLAILGELTASWSAFVTAVFTSGDLVFAVSAAGLAAFLSMRRLTRRQYLAYRLWRQADS